MSQKLEINIRGRSLMVIKKAMASKHGQMAVSMKAVGWMIK